MKTEPTICEKFADNGEHSHWELINTDTGETLWKEGQSSPKIKRLEWKDEGSGYTTLQSPFMSKYDVQYSELHNGFKPRVNYRDGSYWINSLVFDTAEEAKNFCQEDYERRVKECLE